MTRAEWRAPAWLLELALLTGTCANHASAQSPSQQNDSKRDSQNAANVLKTIDQLVEQNRKLEEQNQELMKQLQKLRAVIAQQADPTANHPSSPNKAQADKAGGGPLAARTTRVADDAKNVEVSSTGANRTQSLAPTPPTQQPSTPAQSSGQNQGSGDDKTLFPDASGGNSAIFGEFNPGRGFTVGKGEYGELNLSGYMAVRYLNQFPANQSATDHLGFPITVMPRQDFQFHRVMLFSQGWLFSPKFLYSTFVWTVQDTNQVAVGGALYYTFGKFMTLGAGWNAYPGTMSLQGSHP